MTYRRYSIDKHTCSRDKVKQEKQTRMIKWNEQLAPWLIWHFPWHLIDPKQLGKSSWRLLEKGKRCNCYIVIAHFDLKLIIWSVYFLSLSSCGLMTPAKTNSKWWTRITKPHFLLRNDWSRAHLTPDFNWPPVCSKVVYLCIWGDRYFILQQSNNEDEILDWWFRASSSPQVSEIRFVSLSLHCSAFLDFSVTGTLLIFRI